MGIQGDSLRRKYLSCRKQLHCVVLWRPKEGELLQPSKSLCHQQSQLHLSLLLRLWSLQPKAKNA